MWTTSHKRKHVNCVGICLMEEEQENVLVGGGNGACKVWRQEAAKQMEDAGCLFGQQHRQQDVHW